MARPSKFTDTRQKAILAALRQGCTRTAAAAKGGVDRDTLAAWCLSNSAFSGECTRAEAEAEAMYTAVLEEAARPHEVVEETVTDGYDKNGLPIQSTKTVRRTEFDWRAAESWLKRRRRPEWGDNVNIDLDREIADLLAQLATTGQGEAEG